jgi:hypothetical protein
MLGMIFGRETVDFTQQSVTVSHGLFGVGPWDTLAISDIRDVRVGSVLDPVAQGKWKASFVRACICFEYCGKSRFVCREIWESDAARIVDAIQQRYPELAYKPAEIPETESADERAIETQSVSQVTTKTSPSHSSGFNPLVIGAWSLFMIWAFGINTRGLRLWAQFDGVVTTSRDIPPNRGPRYSTEYTLRGPEGQETHYTSGPTDASLPRSMPVGTSLKKDRWHLDYERDGRRVDDFPLLPYMAILTLVFGCFGWSILRAHRPRR